MSKVYGCLSYCCGCLATLLLALGLLAVPDNAAYANHIIICESMACHSCLYLINPPACDNPQAQCTDPKGNFGFCNEPDNQHSHCWCKP